MSEDRFKLKGQQQDLCSRGSAVWWGTGQDMTRFLDSATGSPVLPLEIFPSLATNFGRRKLSSKKSLTLSLPKEFLTEALAA